jgi:hypothetical protein
VNRYGVGDVAVTKEQTRSTAETGVLQQIKIRLPFLPEQQKIINKEVNNLVIQYQYHTGAIPSICF